MNEYYLIVGMIFVLAMLTIGLFYILISRRIDELTEMIARWESLQANFNKTQYELNVETKKIDDAQDAAAQMLTEKVNSLETDVRIQKNSITAIWDKLHNLSAEIPSERCDELEKQFAELKKQVEDYNEILLDHAMQ